jgi:hypothetical protein
VSTPSTFEAGYGEEGAAYDYYGRTGYTWSENIAEMTIIPNLMPTREFPYDHEPCLYIGPSGWTFTTAYDPRPYFWTPFDTVDKLDENNYENLEVQLELIYSLIVRTLDESLTLYHPNFDYSKRRYPFGYWDNRPHWGIITGRVAVWNESRAWYDDLTKEKLGDLPNALIFFQGARPLDRRFTFAADDGTFKITGGILSNYYHTVSHSMSAWVVDPETGNVVFAPDHGEHRYAGQDLRLLRQAPYPDCMYADIGPFVVFNASTIAILDFISPDNLGVPQAEETGMYLSPIVSVYESGSHLTCTSYGIWTEGQVGVCVVAAKPDPTRPVEITIGAAGSRYPVVVLANTSREQPLGTGFTLKPCEQLTINFPTLKYAQDFYYLNEERFNTLSHFVNVTGMPGYISHLLSEEAIDQSINELQSGEPSYSWAQYQSVNAWIEGRRAYLYARSSIEGMVFVVPFFAALLIPFVFLAEKLIFDLRGLKKIFSFVAVFAAAFASLYLLHPGFQLAANSVSIVIGFSVLVLAFPILLIIFGEASALTQELRVKAVGIHKAEVSRSSQAIFAFTTGIENMKKRKLRTILTLVSIVIMISALVGFTSISTLRVRVEMGVPAGNTNLYNGVYIHKSEWGHGSYDLRDSVFNFIKSKYGDNATIAPRAWLYTLWPNTYAYSYYDISFNVEYQEKRIYPKALLGLTPQEDQFTHISQLYLKEGGRWFEPGDRFVCILSESQANNLGVKVGDAIALEGQRFTVIGIVRDDLGNLIELDGEEFTPVKRDFPPGDVNPWNIHLPLNESLIVDYEDVRLLGGGIASVSMMFDDPALAREAAQEFVEVLPGFMAFSWDGHGVNGHVVIHGARYQTTVWGLQTQAIPIAIVSLAIFNLVLGSVYERRREIGIYGVVGLSPLHVFVLFLAETIVYGVIGGIVGYLAGILMFKIYNLMGGAITIEFSSGSVLLAVGGGMLATVLSSLYPAYMSSKFVTPSFERVWKVPTAPVGDIWELTLPFTAASKDEARGILSYLEEFMREHEIPDAPVFSVENIRHVEGVRADVPFMGLSMECRLVPYQLGIVQSLDVLAAMVEPTRWEIRVVVRRIMGAISEWTRLNRDLFNELREQLLLWRTLPDDVKDRYIKKSTFPKGDESP